MRDKELETIEDAILSYLSICQVNDDPEKKGSDMHAMLENAFKYTKTAICIVKIRNQIHRNNAKLLQVSQEQVQELHQQIWMTFLNLNDWFDAWEMFCLDHGFAEEGD